MKHVGLNVAADPLFTAAYNGVGKGYVLVSADDPSMHSSQNEQDNRYYAKAAKIAMVEPSDSQECLDFMKAAFDISERFNIPGAVPHHHPRQPLQEPCGHRESARSRSSPSTSATCATASASPPSRT
jgi:hypothetical protein